MIIIILDNFNPRSRKGSDRRLDNLESDVKEFQSTLPQGERRSKTGKGKKLDKFQSTLPQGERQQKYTKREPLQCAFLLQIDSQTVKLQLVQEENTSKLAYFDRSDRANGAGFSCSLPVRTRGSEDQRPGGVVAALGPKMLDPIVIAVPEIVKS